MSIAPEERNAMLRLRNIMEGNLGQSMPTTNNSSNNTSQTVELAGPGQITSSDITAMSSVLTRLNNISNDVVDNMITESVQYSDVAEALTTERISNGVKVGRYQILNKSDESRLAGNHFYSIYNSITNDTIADDISLYETALAVVRLLNSGRFTNCAEIRNLYEQDDAYTSHKVDALTYKRRSLTTSDLSKKDIYESRLQASMDRCMTAKKHIKIMAKNVR